MSKRTAFIFMLIIGISYSNAEETKVDENKNLIRNAGFSKGFKYWYAHSFPVEKVNGANVLVISGKPELGKKNSYLKCASNLSQLPKTDVANRKMTFSVMVKAEKVSGKMYFAIREITSDKKSIYRSIKIKKRDNFDWKKMSKTFTTSPKTVKLAVYVVANYLEADDKVMAKNICLCYAK